ncbi:MurR/RpiR family transcriptional regulator [Mumia sp. zg.B17]|uniref:MurR/RpiR family transcriptional regulator n=1 Tax=Mumia sp. zg.B17 TaxID=2855446 RepID=UPI001C6E0116|nr:MurR/RpiR family transcriptional regulator [Mumia sp. zg.B17]MBW9205351.1 MurR/RpiR family transcriptional regulator [Mumia sp. zg.B17]
MTVTGITAPTDGVLARMRMLVPDLPESTRLTAECILDDPHSAVAGTISDLAASAGTSTGAVSRLCRTLGLDGYPSLRVSVIREAAATAYGSWNADISREIAPGDSLADVARTLEAVGARAVHSTLAGLDLDAVAAAAGAISGAKRVHVYAVSGSGVMARELELRLSRIGIACWTYADVHDGLVAAAQLGDGDVAIAISYSGETDETLDMLATARDRGALTVAITAGPRSRLAALADNVLVTVAEATTFQDGPLASRHSELAVVEMLYLAVGQHDYDRTVQLLSVTERAVRPRRPERRRTQTRTDTTGQH